MIWKKGLWTMPTGWDSLLEAVAMGELSGLKRSHPEDGSQLCLCPEGLSLSLLTIFSVEQHLHLLPQGPDHITRTFWKAKAVC